MTQFITSTKFEARKDFLPENYDDALLSEVSKRKQNPNESYSLALLRIHHPYAGNIQMDFNSIVWTIHAFYSPV